MRRRLEELLVSDSIGSGSAFYDAGNRSVKKEDEERTVLYRDGRIFTVKTDRVHVPYEVNDFEKPSQIDTVIYKMLRLASTKKYGKIQKLHKKKDQYYIGKLKLEDIITKFNGNKPTKEKASDCRFVTDYCRYVFLPSGLIKNDNRFQSDVIPMGRAILCGPPEVVGLINKAYDMDEWGKCNFAVYVGNVIVFDTSNE